MHYVHDVDLSFLAPDPNLRRLIEALPGEKYIFTNGSRGYAKNVGEHIDVYDLFDGVFAIEDADYVPKPQRAPYDKFCERFSVDPNTAIMFEDSLKNLEVPKQMGMQTVLVKTGLNWGGDPSPKGKDMSKADIWADHITEDLPGWLSLRLGAN